MEMPACAAFSIPKASGKNKEFVEFCRKHSHKRGALTI